MKKRKFRELRRKAAETVVEKEVEQEIEIEEAVESKKIKTIIEEENNDESFIDID